MEDENGLELSLGLSFGGSSAKSKAKDPTSDPKSEEGSSNKGHVNSSDIHFTSFFQAKTEKSDPIPQPQRSFWTDLGKSPIASSSNTEHVGQSQNPIFQELWMPANKGNDTDEERSSLNKRKMPSEDINFQIKHQKRNSHVSINTGDGSTGENEDVGESEVEGSSSWLVSQSEVSTKRSDVHNYKIADKQLGSESNSEIGKVAYGIPLSFQAVNVMTVPYPVPFKVASASGTAAAAPFNSSCVMQYMPLSTGEKPVGGQGGNAGNLQVAFGYPSMQLPTLETNPFWTLGRKEQGDGTFESQNVEDDKRKSDGLYLVLQSILSFLLPMLLESLLTFQNLEIKCGELL